MLWETKQTENTQSNVIEVGIRRDKNVETDQKYHETVETDANILCQLKQRADRLAFALIRGLSIPLFISISRKGSMIWIYLLRGELCMCLVILC